MLFKPTCSAMEVSHGQAAAWLKQGGSHNFIEKRIRKSRVSEKAYFGKR